jgi:PAS domain S-box-containing protein
MTRRILVVEDSPTQAEMIGSLLEGAGYQVDLAVNGQKGLEKVHTDPPDLIISDALMPEMDGYDFCQAVKASEKTRRIPFVLLTQQNTPEDVLKGLTRGADNFIPKPFEDEKLLERIVRIFEHLEYRRKGQLEVEVKLRVGDRELVINPDKQQIVELLFATFDDVCRLNEELRVVGRKLEDYALNLEAMVEERTEAIRLRGAALDAAANAIIITDRDGRIRYANPAFALLTGHTLEEILGQNPRFLKSGCQSAEFYRDLWATVLDGRVWHGELLNRRKDGSLYSEEMSITPVQDGPGRITHFIAIKADITVRKQAEERERLARQVLDLLNRAEPANDTIRDITLEIKKTTGVDAVGIRLREGDDFPYNVTNGFPEEFLLAERFLCARDQAGELVRDTQGNPVLECMCGNILCGRTDPTLPFFTAGGSFWTNGTTALLASTTEQDRQARTRNRCNSEGYESVALIPLRSGSEIIGLLQLNDRRPNCFTEESIRFFEDMSASVGIALSRKRAEEALRESEALFRGHFEHHAAVKLIIDPDTGNIVDANYAAERFYGWSRDRLQHMRIQDINTLTPEEVKAEMEQARVQTRNHDEFRHRRADGSIRDVEVFSSKITAKGKDLLHFIVHDVSERKRAERKNKEFETQLRQQQKLEALGTLASGVAHEINNPITGIMNYAQLIVDKAEPGSQSAGYAAEIVQETERVATIVRNLLQFARQEKQAHSPARMADIVEQTLSLVRAVLQHDQITLTVDVPEDLPALKCRSQQLQQVVMNLLTNARDALNAKYPGYHADKTITVRVRPFEQGGRPWLRLTVADQGPGIPPEIQARIFDPFFTTKPRDQGTGLGLSISHGIVKDHNGVLYFETEPGIGTQFHLDLPVDNGWTVEEG